jgi:hypothetical protein
MFKLNSIHALILTAGLVGPITAFAQPVAAVDYKASAERISADYKSSKAACDGLAGNAKDICVVQATGDEKVALADLEFRRTAKDEDRVKAATVKAEAIYAVAKERCDDKAGNDKDVCVKEAQATEAKTKADIKLAKTTGQARQDASAEKLDADYKVAIEKCDALAGETKSACIAQSKAKFGKS